MNLKVALCCLVSIVSAITQSPLDQRTLDFKVLDNGLQVLFITDPDVNNSAAAMRVNVGSSQDPKDFYGLAHFLEHMLFIGSEAYPEVDALQHYVAQHGGMTNAFTAQDRTQYYFNVNSEHFERSVDIFTEFFISPTLDPEYIDREKHAVDAEFKMHIKSDGWRRFHLSNMTANPKHPWHRFTIGNLDTLEDQNGSLKDALDAFYKKYYVASNMIFVAVTPEKDEVLETALIEKLSAIPQGEPNINRRKVDYLGVNQKSQVVKMKSLQNRFQLDLDFPIYSEHGDYKAASAILIKDILNYQGKGSVYECLEKQRLIYGLNATGVRVSDFEQILSVQVDLTPLGYQNIDQVIASVVQDIQLMQKKDQLLARFHEIQRVGMLHYLFDHNQSASTQANNYSQAIYNYDEDDISKAQDVTDVYALDLEKMHNQLLQMRLDQARVIISAPDVYVDQVDPYFGVEYSMQPVTAQQMMAWQKPTSCKLSLPGPNKYIPKALPALVKEQSDLKVVASQNHFRWWQKQDGSYKMPKVNTLVKIKMQKGLGAKEKVIFFILGTIADLKLSTTLDPVYDAGNQYSLNIVDDVLNIFTSTWSGSEPLAPEVYKGVMELIPNVDVVDFLEAKDSLIRNMTARDFAAPYRLQSSVWHDLAIGSRLLEQTYLQALNDLTFEEFQQTLSQAFDKVSVEGFEFGSVDQQISKEQQLFFKEKAEVSDGIFQAFPVPEVLSLDSSQTVYLSNQHEDQAVGLYYQFDRTLNNLAITNIVSRMIASDFFEELRTEKQLGYVVSADRLTQNFAPWMRFMVQSPHTSCESIKSHIAEFIATQKEKMIALSDKDFEHIREGIIEELEFFPSSNMSQDFDFYYDKFVTGLYDFNIRQKLANEVKALTKDQVISWWEENIIDSERQIDIAVNCEGEQQTDLIKLKSELTFNRVGLLQ